MKTLFLTGSSQGIGREIAKYFKERDWFVIGLDKKNNNEFADIYINFDLSKPIDKELILNKILDKKIDLLINNAAIQIAKPIYEYNLEELTTSFKVNCISIFELVKILKNRFTEKSSIVNICSVHAIATSKGMAAYVATKGAVLSLTRALALELAPLNIKVNSISPGAVNTEMLQEGLKRTKENFNITQKIPLKKIIEPIEIAKLCYFLADENLSITGQNFIIDGGVLAQLSSENF